MRCVITLLVLLAAAAAHAQDTTSEIDRIFGGATATTPGCVVAVSHNGKQVVNRAYGLADLERSQPLTTESTFDVGSLVKQFVAASTLLLAEDKRLALSDDVRKHLPELPDYGHTITIDHLLTHTSGVRDWTGMLQLAGGNVDALTLTLQQRGLNFTPGEEWSYSNGGYVLLKEIVARTSGMSFADFTRTRLFEPLGMKSTRYLLDVRNAPNRALAYEKAGGGWKQDILLDNARGGGGALFSTAKDLLIWNDALTNRRLGRFVTDTIQEPARLANGRTLGYARGLMLETNEGGKLVWHSGSAAAYKSLLARYPEHRFSIAILCNSGEAANRTQFARRIFELLVPNVVGPAAQAVDAAVDSAGLDLNGKAGLFFSEQNGQPMRLVVEGSRVRIAGGPALAALSADRFRRVGAALEYMSGDAFEVRFVSPDEFDLRSMEGKSTRYRRARAFTPTADELKGFAGRYESPDLNSEFHITPGSDGVMARLNSSSAAVPFRPVDRDTFQIANVLLRFRRNKAGDIVSLDYSNPVVRNIPFTRVEVQR